MNARLLLPLTAAVILAAFHAGASISEPDVSPVSMKIVDLPALTVRPAAADLAYFHSNKVVELATVNVHPEPEDRAYYLASRSQPIVDLPVVAVRAEGVQTDDVATMLVNQVASR